MEPPYIFISYSRNDETYVSKLIQALEDKGLTVWLDDRIDYGTTWPRVIEEHLEKCQVFILVMSSNSLNSHWVQCELNRALALKKPIFPVLLEGTRWLAVETIQCVDVSNQELPPDRFFQQVSDRLQVYAKLRDLLKVGDWKAADQETYEAMIQAVGKKIGDDFTLKELLNFPTMDLKTIDSLWMKYSNGRFGFSVQKQIYLECGAQLDGEYPEGEIWHRFCDRVGWSYSQDAALNFTSSAPSGHLPAKITTKYSPRTYQRGEN
ncbi:MAG: GUN4 domain-containing protein [Nodosilinea sp. LVE1205-7]|jgi:hypothetical protein